MQGIAPEPSPDAVLWRYMSFAKFVGMLTQKGLYMRRADGFADKWEAAIGPAEFRPQYEQAMKGAMQKMIDSDEEAALELSPEQREEVVSNLVNQVAELNRKVRINTFISCWHEANHESEAMWKLYSFDSAEGVAIVTDCRTLKKAIPKKYSLEIGTVQYRDPGVGPSGPLHRFFYKRPAFKHEQEVRLLYLREDTEPGEDLGLVIPMMLNRMIHYVVISPYAPKWVFDATVEVCKRFNLRAPVHSSALGDEPFHF